MIFALLSHSVINRVENSEVNLYLRMRRMNELRRKAGWPEGRKKEGRKGKIRRRDEEVVREAQRKKGERGKCVGRLKKIKSRMTRGRGVKECREH